MSAPNRCQESGNACIPADVRMKMLVLHAPEELGLKQEYIQEHQAGAGH